MKRLHLANIANMAFNYASIQRVFGYSADVLCYDLDHWLSDPSSNLGFTSYPPWFKKVKIAELLSTLPKDAERLSRDWIETLQRYSIRASDVTSAEIGAYAPYADALKPHLDRYDVVYGYSYGAIPPLLYSERKFIPVDLGSLRGLSQRTDAFSRMLTYSFKSAPYIIVTNPDVVDDCKALGLDRYVFVPHPIDETIWSFSSDQNRRLALREELNAEFIILAPARHDWFVKGNQEIIAGVVEFAKSSSFDVRCILVEWGEEVQRSKDLIREFGAVHLFVWRPLLSECDLKDLYNSVDALVDQVGEARTFGLTTPKAMASGVPVLTRYDAALHEWCYSEPPPLLPIENRTCVASQLRSLADMPCHRLSVATNQRRWIEKHHSREIVAQRLSWAEDRYLKDPKACSRYNSLNQKKHELVYEQRYAEIYDKKYHDAEAYRLMDKWVVEWMASHIDSSGPVKILDLGCGPGSMTSLLRSIKDAEIHGVDLSPAFIGIARARHPAEVFQLGDVEAIPYESQTFDAVLCSGVLHHLPDLSGALPEIRRVLKPNGILFAREPNRDNFASRYPVTSFAHLVLKHLLHISHRSVGIVEPEAHEFHIDFSHDSLVDVLAKEFQVVDLQFGQRVSYFYDMLMDRGVRDLLTELEDQLSEVPGLNVLVACRAAEPGVADHVRRTLELMEKRPELNKDHCATIKRFALATVMKPDDYQRVLFRLAAAPITLARRVHKLAHSVEIRVCSDGVSTRSSRRNRPWHARSDTMMLKWGQKDHGGNDLYDCGIIEVASGSPVDGLVEALCRFRDYSLILLQISPDVAWAEVALSTPQRNSLSQCYILGEVLTAAGRLIVASPKLFSFANFQNAVSSADPKLLWSQRILSAPQTDIYYSNLFRRLAG